MIMLFEFTGEIDIDMLKEALRRLGIEAELKTMTLFGKRWLEFKVHRVNVSVLSVDGVVRVRFECQHQAVLDFIKRRVMVMASGLLQIVKGLKLIEDLGDDAWFDLVSALASKQVNWLDLLRGIKKATDKEKALEFVLHFLTDDEKAEFMKIVWK